MCVLIGFNQRMVNVICIVAFIVFSLTGCDQDAVDQPISCSVCGILASFVKRVKIDTGEEHLFSREVDAMYQQIVSDGAERYSFFAKPQALFEKNTKDQCGLALSTKFGEWLPNIERQAEEIAKKSLSCNQQCPQYNCGEYVDFSGMNMEITELLTLLEDRFLDAALSSADIPGLSLSNTQSYQQKLEALLFDGVDLVEKVALKISKDKDEAYQQKLIDHALQLDDMAQTTIALKWVVSVDIQNTPSLLDILSRIAEASRQFAYQYGQLFSMSDGGKATASIQKDLALSSLLQLGRYQSLLLNLKQSSIGLELIDVDKELACYESLAVKLGVTKELFAIASDTVAQCGLQQHCKTNAYPIFDAITQNQLTTESLIGKLNDVNGILDKVVYSYTSAKCN